MKEIQYRTLPWALTSGHPMPNKLDLCRFLIIIKWLKCCQITVIITDGMSSKNLTFYKLSNWPNCPQKRSLTMIKTSLRTTDVVLRIQSFSCFKSFSNKKKKETLYSYWPGRWQLSIVQWFLKFSRYSSWNIFPEGTWRKRILWKILFWAVKRQGKFHPAWQFT